MTTQWRPMLVTPISPATDHVLGPPDAPVTLVEYGDYQCPYCAAAQPVVATVLEEMGQRLLFAFRHFPLTTIHAYAETAAEAAEAAGAQQRFWEMHDTLFANQPRLQPEQLATYAKAIGLDVSRFAKSLTERAFAEKIANDFMGGVRSGVNGTPTFFVNGVRHDGPNDSASLLAALERSLVFR